MNDSDHRKGNVLQYSEMGILTDNITGSVYNGAIYKLVVVRVLFNKVELKVRVFSYDIGRTSDDLQK